MNTQDILAHSSHISLDPAAVKKANKLCEIWPTVKEGLTLLGGIIKNPVVKITISAVTAAGDAVMDKICAKK